MSDERKEEKKRGAAGGSFEQGMRSALDKAPGFAAPAWVSMQTAIAGGAAGGAAGVTWRWIVGPAATAAVIGGALWWANPDADSADEEVTSEPREGTGWFDDEVAPDHAVWQADDVESAVTEADEPPVPSTGGKLENGVLDAAVASDDPNVPADGISDAHPDYLTGDAAGPAGDSAASWADIPVEKAAAFGVDVEAACVGTEIGFRMVRPLDEVRVLWNFGDGQFSSDAEPQHIFRAPGTYDITLSVTRLSDGLIRTRTIENLVTIHPNPEADFTWEVPSLAQKSPQVNMRNRSRDASSATWIVDGETSRAGESAAFNLDRVGEHVVQLVASSPHGCQSVAQHSVEVGSRFGIGGSGRFSPNGDGRYDVFLPRGLMQMDRPFVFRVEDIDGKIVFETTRPESWDGALPEGGLAQPGDKFAWTVVVQGEQGPAYFSDEVVIE